jgi:hypothetical protein
VPNTCPCLKFLKLLSVLTCQFNVRCSCLYWCFIDSNKSLTIVLFHRVQVWEFDQAHQRWLPVAELTLPEDKGDQVYAVAWAPNIGR